MRFTLGLTSVVLLANMVYATPAADTQVNMGIDANEFKADQVSQLEMKQDFESFHWKQENKQKLVDRVFKFELNEPAELQITDFMKGKLFIGYPFFYSCQLNTYNVFAI